MKKILLVTALVAFCGVQANPTLVAELKANYGKCSNDESRRLWKTIVGCLHGQDILAAVFADEEVVAAQAPEVAPAVEITQADVVAPVQPVVAVAPVAITKAPRKAGWSWKKRIATVTSVTAAAAIAALHICRASK